VNDTARLRDATCQSCSGTSGRNRIYLSGLQAPCLLQGVCPFSCKMELSVDSGIQEFTHAPCSIRPFAACHSLLPGGPARKSNGLISLRPTPITRDIYRHFPLQPHERRVLPQRNRGEGWGVHPIPRSRRGLPTILLASIVRSNSSPEIAPLATAASRRVRFFSRASCAIFAALS
jgi:hypothetical protein